MKDNTTKKMASILNVTDSAYYPCFRWAAHSRASAVGEARCGSTSLDSPRCSNNLIYQLSADRSE